MRNKFHWQQFKESGGQIHFIGCAGAGTQPLASIFLDLGFSCSGSDLVENERTGQLRKRGMTVHLGHNRANLPSEGRPLVVVHTSAAGEDNPELAEARRRGALILRRGEALARLGTLFPHTIAVAGSHGKTSVTALITHALKKLGRNPGYLIGGTVCGWPLSGSAGNKELFVTEVDESDSTHALFHAGIAVVTNIEDDHSWSVGGEQALFESFRVFAARAERLVCVPGPNPDRLFQPFREKTVSVPDDIDLLRPWPSAWGGFQRRNAVTAFTAVQTFCAGTASDAEIAGAILTFPGVERRMSIRFDNGDSRIVEDYAHHPTELKASLEALKETNPGRRLVVIFQPHRFARLQRYLPEFASLLAQWGDLVILPPVFAAWTDRSEVDSHTLADRIGSKAHAWEGSWDDLACRTAAMLRKGDLIAVIGAGDVKEIIPPLEEAILRKAGSETPPRMERQT